MLVELWRASSWALRIGCGVHMIHNNIYEVSETSGESMLPTLNYSGDFVHANKMSRNGRNCSNGDIIIAAKPTDPVQRVCKRITGMPGDTVLVDPTDSESPMIRVPPGHVWVTGDNLTQSLDSRSYGPLAMGLIRGKVFAVNSLTDFQWLPNGMSDVDVLRVPK